MATYTENVMAKLNKEVGNYIDLSRIASEAKINEAQGVDDFTSMATTIDRSVLAGYTSDTEMKNYATLGYRYDTPTFEAGTMYRINALKSVNRVPEFGSFPTNDPSDESYTVKTDKYGETMEFSAEAWLRDRDLGLLRVVSTDMMAWGAKAEYTKQSAFSSAIINNTLCANTHTDHTGSRNVTNGDNLLATTSLTEANLGIAISKLKTFSDPYDNLAPYNGRVFLLVPAALEVTAKRIINSTLSITGEDATVGNANVLYGAAQVIVDPHLDADSTTTWYLLADPMSGRPAFRYGYVVGQEQPQVAVRSNDITALMGGNDVFGGSFENDTIAFRLKFTFGVDELDWRGIVKCTA